MILRHIGADGPGSDSGGPLWAVVAIAILGCAIVGGMLYFPYPS